MKEETGAMLRIKIEIIGNNHLLQVGANGKINIKNDIKRR
jgi:hypothetical protein